MNGRILLPIALALGAVSGLGACDERGTIQTIRGAAGAYNAAGARSALRYAGLNGPVLLEVRGAGFVEPPAVVAATVARIATGAVIGAPVAFTADRAAAARPTSRVIVAFDMPPAIDARRLCAGPSPAAVRGERLAAVAAFCAGTASAAESSGLAPRALSVGDPVVARFVAQLVYDLFPRPAYEDRIPSLFERD